MIQRKQCLECGAHTFGRVCSVCRSFRLEALQATSARRRFSRRRAQPEQEELRQRMEA